MARDGDWSRLFSGAFRHSRNAMVLLDGLRRVVDCNGAFLQLMGYQRKQVVGQPIHQFVAGGPIVSPAEWKAALARGDFSGEAELITAVGSSIAVQYAATTEIVTGRQLVLLVALSTSRWGRRFRRPTPPGDKREPLSPREREIVRLIALGSTSPEIAEELRIAHDTVRTHARNAMVKAGARSRAHLVAKVLGEGLIFELEPELAAPEAPRYRPAAVDREHAVSARRARGASGGSAATGRRLSRRSG